MKAPALLALVLLAFSACAFAQQKVEAVGITPAVKLEEVISGHLTELTFAPGAALGVHHRFRCSGPDLR